MAPRRRRNDRRAQRSSSPPRQPERSRPHHHPAPPPPPPPPPMPTGSLRPDDATLRTSPPPPPPMPPGRPESAPHQRPPLPEIADVLRRKERERKTTPEETSSSSIPQATRREERERETTLEEICSSSMPQATSHQEREKERKPEETSSSSMPRASRSQERERETKPEETSSSSMPQARFKVSDLEALNLDITLLASSCISTLRPTGLMIKYFVRVDNDGFFYIYPDHGGPFESIQEVQEAIDSHHAVHRQNLCMDGLSDEERAVRYALFWYHNGTRKHSAEAFTACTTNLPTKELVKALLDKYNEDNGLVGDVAYELEDIVNHNSCYDGKDHMYSSYYHFNLTIKTKEADANSDLYFAEVTCMDGNCGYEAYVLTCICMVKPEDNGGCYVCGPDIKHPTHVGFNHGRPQMSRGRSYNREYGVALFEKLFAVHDEAWLQEEEVRVRRVIKEGLEAEEASRKFEVDHKSD